MDALRYLLPASFMVITGFGIFNGGIATWSGLALFPIVAFAEYFMKDDMRLRNMGTFSGLFMLYIQFIPWIFMWYALWHFLTAPYVWWEWLGTFLSISTITAAVGLPVAHELFHRHDNVSRFIGNLFAVTLMAGDVEKEHRIGHHIETSSATDVDTPYRGESVYGFIPKLLIFFHTAPWELEKKRFANKGKSHWTLFNPLLWAWLGFFALAAVFVSTAGWQAGLTVVAISSLGQSIVCIFSYVQHYGLIRVPGTPIENRHALNHIRPLSRILTFEIVTHSQHHTDPTLPYWQLTPYEDVIRPGSAYGYFLLTFIPPLWHKVMRKHLTEWDEKYADAAELKLAEAANRKAGWVI
ncbi:MAG: fatty acid desaturase [Porticoccaceae bacterium]|nr:fatty acid desaturase [Porticoccaceae bacterium]